MWPWDGMPKEAWTQAELKSYVKREEALTKICLLYTSDAADEPCGVDLGGRRIIKKKIF